MKVQVISTSYDRTRAEIVLKGDGTSVTRHVVLEKDGNYHWRKKDASGKEIAHETYSL